MDKLLKRVKELDPEERKRLQQYFKESKDGKEKEKGQLDWMYKSGKPDAEEYLLGKKIDSIADDESTEQNTSGSVVPDAGLDEIIARRQNIDMKVKMREDPLYQIRQREEESKKKLLDNPIKMKQLQKMLEEKTKKEKKKKKKKEKKKKKKKDGSDSSSDSDNEIFNQYVAILKGKEIETSKKSKHSDSDRRKRHGDEHDGGEKRRRRSEERDQRLHRSHTDKSTSKPRFSSRTPRDSSPTSSPEHTRSSHHHHRDTKHRDTRHRDREQTERSKHSISHKRHSSASSDDNRDTNRSAKKSKSSSNKSHKHSKHTRSDSSSSESDSAVKRRKSRDDGSDGERTHVKQYGLIGGKAKRRDGSPKRRRSITPPKAETKKRERSPPRRKLTKEEMDRKRREMMENASWRDEQREKNVKSYREQDNKEEEDTVSEGSHFITSMMRKHNESSSVQDRIKRNIYNVQRTHTQLDKKFTQK